MRRKLLLCLSLVTISCQAAVWQYRVPYEGKSQTGDVLFWLPAQAKTLRGVIVMGQIVIESEFAADAAIRDVCRRESLGMVYFRPHLDGVFHYWEPGNTSGARLLKALDDLAAISGHPEVRRVPWIPVGHSTAGIFARNVAYWKPDRVAAVIHIKSGNFHQNEHLPPEGSLAGIPLLALNGQFEVFGPEGGIRAEYGRETQWRFVRADLLKFRERDPEQLMSLAVEPGADHYHLGPADIPVLALFLSKTAARRLPRELPAGDGPVAPLPVAAQSGFVDDGLWHYDRDMAAAVARLQANLDSPLALGVPAFEWVSGGDGWTFRARSEWLDRMPDEYGGRFGGRPVPKPARAEIDYFALAGEPVMRVGAGLFRVLRPVKAVNVGAYRAGVVRFGEWKAETVARAAPQTIQFTPPSAIVAGTRVRLGAHASSGLPIYYEVEFGPLTIASDGTAEVAELPRDARLPMTCRVTAWQIGRRTSAAIAPAAPVTVEIQIVRGPA